MSVKTKTLILQFLSFTVLFVLARIAFVTFTDLHGFWLSGTSAVVATLLAPQFKVFKTDQGEKICMRWLLLKGVKVLN